MDEHDEFEHEVEDNEKGVWDFILFIAPVCVFAIVVSIAFIYLLFSIC